MSRIKFAVEQVAIKVEARRFQNCVAFQLRRDRPLLWMQKVCFWVLRKLKAFYIDEKQSITRHRIDADTFMERLFKQKAGVERFLDRPATRLFIGAEDYAELMEEEIAKGAFSFDARYHHAGWGGDREILDMRVEGIPWMRGVLVMP